MKTIATKISTDQRKALEALLQKRGVNTSQFLYGLVIQELEGKSSPKTIELLKRIRQSCVNKWNEETRPLLKTAKTADQAFDIAIEFVKFIDSIYQNQSTSEVQPK